VKIRVWGTRGSLASPTADTVRYGGNTPCVEVRGADGALLVLDAGTGIRRLGASIDLAPRRIDVLLSHLHMDHIQGLGFFKPLFVADMEIHVWGPPSVTQDLRARLARYLSPPLFPVNMRELPCRLSLHDVPLGRFDIGSLRLAAALVCHPGPTVGYRIIEEGISVAYLPDHEPALGAPSFPQSPEWTSGFDLAAGADVLIHDSQYTLAEYAEHVGWGHSAVAHALAFAALTGARRLVTFHHDPGHDDQELDQLHEEARRLAAGFELIPGQEGLSLEFSGNPPTFQMTPPQAAPPA
jgi:phosphoribosyl 1,2-cyclic phosphodiesterase